MTLPEARAALAAHDTAYAALLERRRVRGGGCALKPPRTAGDVQGELFAGGLFALLGAFAFLSIFLDWPAVDRWLIAVFHGL